MTKTPHEIEGYDTHRKWCFTKMAHITKKCPNFAMFAKDWAEWFLTGNS